MNASPSGSTSTYTVLRVPVNDVVKTLCPYIIHIYPIPTIYYCKPVCAFCENVTCAVVVLSTIITRIYLWFLFKPACFISGDPSRLGHVTKVLIEKNLFGLPVPDSFACRIAFLSPSNSAECQLTGTSLKAKSPSVSVAEFSGHEVFC